ncbi:spermidine synthase [endosymbiont of unidentified scaly snail isolate Monju]|uniref:spermidine synthase n=1 Tax=endosymbiont of unidentified scaly snail isolate Monju TaxID=1248727 RepID=UPI00038926C8|nr:hypothetical protein [endosymbiont of unidentified scaly snail isolate Monju]BAN68624.1 conserved hypothetical protein [endosymbiont of unidentified scaly snail isolate Monju]
MAETTDKPHPLGRIVARREDACGPVEVRELGQHRFLTFGNVVEQSCCNTAQPWRLEHVYTQAMMLGLLLRPDPGSALILGLGGGSLVRALRHAAPDLRLAAVESRQAVIELAIEWFGVDPGDPQLRLHCADAADFVAGTQERFDLIFADLYLAEGVNPVQTRLDFLEHTRERLARHGLLLLNAWCSEFRDARETHQALDAVFGEFRLALHVQGGNSIIFAFRDHLPVVDRNRLFSSAQAMGLRLDIPLQRLARTLWRQNAQALRSGRYRPG